MTYLLIFYWIFAALFSFGTVYGAAKKGERNIFAVFIGCILFGGIYLPIYLGLCFAEKYE